MGFRVTDLKAFIIDAHANTFASDTSKQVLPFIHGADSSAFTHFPYGSDLIYHDSYFGNRRFIGEEIVFHTVEGDRDKCKKPLWGMNYYGQVLGDRESGPIYSFLKKALRVGVEVKSAFRGPKFWETEVFKYESKMEGDLNQFSGEEEIYFKGELVYKAVFHGGKVE